MKTKTVVKVLKRLSDSLERMEQIETMQEIKDKCKFDRLAIEQAISIVERSNTLS